MIDSALYSRSTAINIPLDFPIELEQSKLVNKSTLYHMIHSYLQILQQDKSMIKVEKHQTASEFGFSLGKNIAEQQCLGQIKYFIPKQAKDKPRPFIGEMKFLYTKVWVVIFGSNCKLYAITNQNASYKIQDKQFGLTKFLFGSDEQYLNSYKKLIMEFSQGVIEGFFDKFDLYAQINYAQKTENEVLFEVKGISRKVKSSIK